MSGTKSGKKTASSSLSEQTPGESAKELKPSDRKSSKMNKKKSPKKASTSSSSSSSSLSEKNTTAGSSKKSIKEKQEEVTATSAITTISESENDSGDQNQDVASTPETPTSSTAAATTASASSSSSSKDEKTPTKSPKSSKTNRSKSGSDGKSKSKSSRTKSKGTDSISKETSKRLDDNDDDDDDSSTSRPPDPEPSDISSEFDLSMEELNGTSKSGASELSFSDINDDFRPSIRRKMSIDPDGIHIDMKVNDDGSDDDNDGDSQDNDKSKTAGEGGDGKGKAGSALKSTFKYTDEAQLAAAAAQAKQKEKRGLKKFFSRRTLFRKRNKKKSTPPQQRQEQQTKDEVGLEGGKKKSSKIGAFFSFRRPKRGTSSRDAEKYAAVFSDDSADDDSLEYDDLKGEEEDEVKEMKSSSVVDSVRSMPARAEDVRKTGSSKKKSANFERAAPNKTVSFNNVVATTFESADPPKQQKSGKAAPPKKTSSGSSLKPQTKFAAKTRSDPSQSMEQALIAIGPERVLEWAKKFRRSDPRYQILNFFGDAAQQRADLGASTSSIGEKFIESFYRSSIFTVWRPTSFDAIRRMMLGEGVGKGLDIKGKSAKKGKLSGFVPYLQIHDEKHKKDIRTPSRDGRIRVFFNSVDSRDQVVANLSTVRHEMTETVKHAKAIVEEDEANEEECLDEKLMEWALEKLVWDMPDPTINLLDMYAPRLYGIDVPERLFLEGFVIRQDCTRVPFSDNDTGRPSEPGFQNMNNASLRREPNPGEPKAVLLLYEPEDGKNDEEPSNPMSPLNLLMAYEEHGRVMPVVSDFDCFMVGTRGVHYEKPIPKEQVAVLSWCVDQIEKILEGESRSSSWTSRWLDVLKESASKGYHPDIPALGFSDPKSHDLMKNAIHRLKKEGAVRHGAECFNYYFPQELDKEFLVISENLSGHTLPWKYVNSKGLRDILKEKIKLGYTFPINPKWILCDRGWKVVYDKLMASKAENVQDSLKVWYPPDSGIREKIESICKKNPQGFQRSFSDERRSHRFEEVDGTAAMDLATLELKYYLTLQRAKRKLRGVLVWKKILNEVRKKKERKQMMLSELTQTTKRVSGIHALTSFKTESFNYRAAGSSLAPRIPKSILEQIEAEDDESPLPTLSEDPEEDSKPLPKESTTTSATTTSTTSIDDSKHSTTDDSKGSTSSRGKKKLKKQGSKKKVKSKSKK